MRNGAAAAIIAGLTGGEEQVSASPLPPSATGADGEALIRYLRCVRAR